MRLLNSRTAAVGVAGLLLVAVGVGSATAASQITGKQIKDHSIGAKELKQGLLDRVDGAMGPQGPQGPAGPAASDKLGSLAGSFANTDATTVANVGGSFKTGATIVGKFDLPAGTYQLNADGFFDTKANNTAAGTHMQLAIRDAGTGEFGNDLGTCFTPAIPVGDREATCTTTRLVTLSKSTTLYVKAFGYNDDQSADNSGNATVKANVSAIKVG